MSEVIADSRIPFTVSAGDCRDVASVNIDFVWYAIQGVLQQLTYQYQFQYLIPDIVLSLQTCLRSFHHVSPSNRVEVPLLVVY